MYVPKKLCKLQKKHCSQVAEVIVRELGPARQPLFSDQLQLGDQTAEQIDAEVKRLLAVSLPIFPFLD